MAALLKYASWLCGGLAVFTMAVVAPKGEFLVSTPTKGKIQAAPDHKDSNPTVRSRGPSFIWLGGGYHGGK